MIQTHVLFHFRKPTSNILHPLSSVVKEVSHYFAKSGVLCLPASRYLSAMWRGAVGFWEIYCNLVHKEVKVSCKIVTALHSMRPFLCGKCSAGGIGIHCGSTLESNKATNNISLKRLERHGYDIFVWEF